MLVRNCLNYFRRFLNPLLGDDVLLLLGGCGFYVARCDLDASGTIDVNDLLNATPHFQISKRLPGSSSSVLNVSTDPLGR